MWRGYIYDLDWSRFGVEPAELSEFAENGEVFRVFLELLPSQPSCRKTGVKTSGLL